jgi:uncharacterized protein YjiS (DUF1127 family)
MPEKRCFADVACAILLIWLRISGTELVMSILTLRGALHVIGATGRRYDRNDDAAGWIAGSRRTIARWIARSRQRRALRDIAECNDHHLLKDIGVSRDQAFREAEKPFWRR